MKILTDLIYLILAVAISPMVVYRMLRQNRYRIGWENRFGKIVRNDPHKQSIWLHAVSVGEVNAAKTLVNLLHTRFPKLDIAISTTTDTGFARATTLFGSEHNVFFFPLDLSPIVNRAFENIRPAICLLMELEVWPNFVATAKEMDIPVVVLNGRISERSFARYKLIKPIVRSIFKKLTLVLAQTDEYASRFKDLGCPTENVIVTGSLKYDTAQITDKVDGSDILASQLNLTNEKLWVAGGTGVDEEKILLDIYKQLKPQFHDLRLVLVPRKPERFDEVAQLIQQSGFPLVRYSRIKAGSVKIPADPATIILGDTMGDLRKFYSLAHLIFVGRSLVPMGGSDMMEAAALGKCTIFGPHAFNFKQTVGSLLQGNGAIMVQDSDDLLQTMQKCLTNPDFASSIAQNGQAIIRKNQGATEKSAKEITKLLLSSPW